MNFNRQTFILINAVVHEFVLLEVLTWRSVLVDVNTTSGPEAVKHSHLTDSCSVLTLKCDFSTLPSAMKKLNFVKCLDANQLKITLRGECQLVTRSNVL